MSKSVKKYTCWSIQFCSGGAGYGLIEILWRGYTHISMLIAGGICFWLLIRIAKLHFGLLLKSMLGGLCITIVEFAAGCIVNLWLKLSVWDYSGEAAHIMGQICARYCLLWIVLCSITIPICSSVIRLRTKRLVRPERPSPGLVLFEHLQEAARPDTESTGPNLNT